MKIFLSDRWTSQSGICGQILHHQGLSGQNHAPRETLSYGEVIDFAHKLCVEALMGCDYQNLVVFLQ
jgi:hypothetical protein